MICMTLCFLACKTNAQVDTSRVNEIRFSYFGATPFPIYLEGYHSESTFFWNPTITYLRKLNQKQWFFVSELGAFNRQTYDYRDGFEDLDDTGSNRYATLFLGLEKQHQFKHLAVFYSFGVKGGYSNFKGSFNLMQDQPLRDITIEQSQAGLSARLTIVTNISENFYLFANGSINAFIYSKNYNEELENDCCLDGNGSGLEVDLIDAVGIAYKF